MQANKANRKRPIITAGQIGILAFASIFAGASIIPSAGPTFAQNPSTSGANATTTTTDSTGTTTTTTTTGTDAAGNPTTITTTTHSDTNGNVDSETVTTKFKDGHIKVVRKLWKGGRKKANQKPSTTMLYEGPDNRDKASLAPTGLKVAEFTTPKGNLRVNLPADLAAGDTISGTVTENPAGSSSQEQDANTNELNGYVVEVAGQKTKVGNQWGKWIIPAAITGITLILRDSHGNVIGRQSVPVCPPIQAVPPALTGPAQPGDFHLPTVGQVGKPIVCQGPFHSDLNATTVTVGGEDVPILAESPRQAIALCPRDIVGPTNIQVTEGSVVCKGDFRSVDIKLSVPKTTLHTGEKSQLTVMLSGLAGLNEPLPLHLANRSPDVLHLKDGDTQTVMVAPKNVQPDGTCAVTVPITGVHPGAFAIAATLAGN